MFPPRGSKLPWKVLLRCVRGRRTIPGGGGSVPLRRRGRVGVGRSDRRSAALRLRPARRRAARQCCRRSGWRRPAGSPRRQRGPSRRIGQRAAVLACGDAGPYGCSAVCQPGQAVGGDWFLEPGDGVFGEVWTARAMASLAAGTSPTLWPVTTSAGICSTSWAVAPRIVGVAEAGHVAAAGLHGDECRGVPGEGAVALGRVGGMVQTAVSIRSISGSVPPGCAVNCRARRCRRWGGRRDGGVQGAFPGPWP